MTEQFNPTKEEEWDFYNWIQNNQSYKIDQVLEALFKEADQALEESRKARKDYVDVRKSMKVRRVNRQKRNRRDRGKGRQW